MSNPISPVASHVATSCSVCLQMITAVVPVPVPVLCAVLGFGAAMLVHNEMGQCARSSAARRRRLVNPTAPLDDEPVDEETALLEQEALVGTSSSEKNCRTSRRNTHARSMCSRPRWAGRAEGARSDDDKGCCPRSVVRRISRGFSWSNSSAPISDPVAERDLAALSVALSQGQGSGAGPTPEDDDTPDARCTAAVARQLGPEASHIGAAIEHMRFKLDSLMVWKRSVVPSDHTLPAPSSASASGPAEITGSTQ